MLKIFAALFAVLFVSCSNYYSPDELAFLEASSEQVYSYKGSKASKKEFEFDKALFPLSKSKFVYDEPIAFVGKDDEATLLFEPKRIYSVWNYEKTIQYEQGKDFVVKGNKIKLTENTRIKYWNPKDYYSTAEDDLLVLISKDNNYIKFEYEICKKYQILVSYDHAETYDLLASAFQGTKLLHTLSKLGAGETVNILFLGDSITVGAEGDNDKTKGELYNSYVNLIKYYLESMFPNQIFVQNISIGGMASDKALDFAKTCTAVPDLVCIAFGMNELNARNTPKDYKRNIESAMTYLRLLNGNCEFVLVSTMLPNTLVKQYRACDSNVFLDSDEISYYAAELKRICESDPRAALVPMSSVSAQLYARKSPASLLSNNFNHPASFLHRIYAQEFLRVLLGDAFTPLK